MYPVEHIFGPFLCLRSCKHTFYGHLSRIRIRFIRKVLRQKSCYPESFRFLWLCWSCNKYVACLPNWPREGKVKQNCSIYPKLRQPCTNCKIRITPFVRYIGSIVFLSFIDKKWIKGNEFSAKSLDGANPNNFIYKVNIVWHDEWETETLIIIQPTTWSLTSPTPPDVKFSGVCLYEKEVVEIEFSLFHL